MSVRVLDCPQCGAPVTLRSPSAVFAVCEHCRSMVVVRGVDVESIGVIAELPPDLSPFQIGTHGEWQGHGFEIVGRVRVEWAEGSWNEWCILYDSTKTGWLAEAQGLLMISFETALGEPISLRPDDYVANKQINLNGKPWTVSDVKEVTCRSSEGELPFASPAGTRRTSIDLGDKSGGFASLELGAEHSTLYAGQYVGFDELKITNLRAVPGWNAEVQEERNQTTALACPACGAVINLRAAGQSMSAVCGSCGVVIDTATPEFKVIQKADIANRELGPLLPLGQRGKLFGVEYEVIGMQVRSDKSSRWSEYLLFNPWQGFRWLVSFQGHWSFIDRLVTVPEVTSRTAKFNGRNYQLFDEATAMVTGVLGEFYWQVRRGERAETSDFIAPPYILSKEAYPDLNETAWSRGEYIAPKVIAEAFGVKDAPAPQGVYLNQPNPYAIRWREIRAVFFAAVVVLWAIHTYTALQHRERTVTTSQFVHTHSPKDPSRPGATVADILAGAEAVSTEPSKTFTTPHFKLDGNGQPVVIEADAGVDNDWIDLDFDLVNVQTNASYPASVELSYYHGSDEDGPWSEGSSSATVPLPAVPAGEYFLAVETDADPQIQSLPFNVRVKAGGVYTSNFIVMLVIVLCYPVTLLWRSYTFERERWDDSDFNPYQHHSS